MAEHEHLNMPILIVIVFAVDTALQRAYRLFLDALATRQVGK